MDNLTRRQALKILGTGAAVLAFPGCSSLFRKSASLDTEPDDPFSQFSPVDRGVDARLGNRPQTEFSGDEPSSSHAALWNIAELVQKQGGYPAPSEKTKIVIVGGGMSGLLSTHFLQEYRPIVLERGRRFGGNARGESWNGIDYGLGAAYVMGADEGSDLEKLHDELGLRDFCRYKTDEDPVVWHNKSFTDFWSGQTDPKRKTQFMRLKRYFIAVLNEEEFEGRSCKFPDIPIENEADRPWIEKLDRQDFKSHLETVLKEKIHPHIAAVIEHYCWSSFGASMQELSAAAGLNFFAAEFGEVIVAPGGNALIAEKLLHRLYQALPNNHLRNASTVIQVRVDGDRVITTYLDGTGKLKAIESESVVLSCPKFVVKRILADIEPERLAGIARLKYRSYLVANLLVDQKLTADHFDWYLLGEGKVDYSDIRATADKQGFTDVIFANFARREGSTQSVLSLYRGLPYDFARPEVLMDGSYARFKKEFETQIHRDVLPLLKIEASAIRGLRLSRWGHPMPVAEKNFVADRVPEVISKPFKNRVFFAEQDNWALPCFETAAFESRKWAGAVRRLLG